MPNSKISVKEQGISYLPCFHGFNKNNAKNIHKMNAENIFGTLSTFQLGFNCAAMEFNNHVLHHFTADNLHVKTLMYSSIVKKNSSFILLSCTMLST
jgi:hypothetical protein